MKNEKKWYRMWTILSFALSVLLKVYWYRIKKKSEPEWESLWETIGREFRETLYKLEGLLIKVGQLLSIRADLLPHSFINQIKDLVDQVPPSPWNEIKTVLEREWGVPIEEKMQSFGTVPVASASIGEVYRGQLKDGTEVAVKVQRPKIRAIIRTDFRSLSIIFWFAQHFAPVPKGFINFTMLFKELKHVIERELDFTKEMDTINRFRQRFQTYQKLSIPKTFPELSTSQVLVMEWIKAARITDVDFLDKHHINRDELSRYLVRVFLPQWLEAGHFHADPHAGNILVKADGTLVLLDFGMVGEITKKDAANFQELLEAILLKNYTEAAERLIDLGFLLPEANPQVIKSLLKEALSIDLSQLKEMDLFAVKKEMKDIVKSLPIQVPTRFIFLGRSFVTIEGLLHTINPNEEIIEIAKPEFMEWVNRSNLNKWKLLIKWMNNQPIFKMFHSISNLLEAPNRILEQKDYQQQRELSFLRYENMKKQSFCIGVLGVIGAMFGNYFQHGFIWNSSFGLIVLAILGYGICSWKQRKWISFKKR